MIFKDDNEKTYYTKTLKNSNSLKRGEKVLLKEDNRIYTIYDIYNIKEVSLSLFGYTDTEQDYRTNIKDILIKDDNAKLLYKDTIKKQFEKPINTDKIIIELMRDIKAPYVKGDFGCLGGNDIYLIISLDKPENWVNSILENSDYGKFRIGGGIIEMFSGSLKPIRKTRYKNNSEVVDKLNKYLNKVRVLK